MLAIFGGSFNPPHIGHVKTVLSAAAECNIAKVGLMPCKMSPLKTDIELSGKHRINMLEGICTSYSNKHITLYPETIELTLPEPSYTINTLRQLHKKMDGFTPVCFFLGEDSLYTLNEWREWQQLLDYCHLIVMPRENTKQSCDNDLLSWLKAHQIKSPNALSEQTCGFIYRCNSPLVTISSTKIRNALKSNNPMVSTWLPPSVLTYIKAHGLYNLTD